MVVDAIGTSKDTKKGGGGESMSYTFITIIYLLTNIIYSLMQNVINIYHRQRIIRIDKQSTQ